uniref:RRM domain-containing protein n=1 Tax=Graphocephala atropunctata TaxID=36148 RepID=A0A1B6M4A1_9HEMI
MGDNGQNDESMEESDNFTTSFSPTMKAQTSVDTTSLINSINELDSLNFGDEWKQNFYEVLNKSLNYEMSYTTHSDSWLSILSKLSGWDSLIDLFVDSMKVTISTMPLTSTETSTTWVTLIEMVLDKILKFDLDYNDVQTFFDLTDKKFGSSYFRASQYWKLVRTFEVKFVKKQNLPEEEIKTKIVEIYKKQFSRPYQEMADDWEKFKSTVKELNIDSEQKVEVQAIFLANSMEAQTIEEEYPGNLDPSERLHHLKFESWVKTLLEKKPPCFDTIEVLCEEMIFEESDSYCFYHVYVSALASEAFSMVQNRADKLYSIIKRGLIHGKTGCYNTVTRFTEHALLVASGLLESEKFIELVDLAVTAILHFPCINSWFYTRRGVLIAVKNKIMCGDIDACKLKEVFVKALKPVTFDYYKSNTLPQVMNDMTGLDERLLELLKIWILGEKEIRQLSDTMAFEMWKELVDRGDNPLALLTYGDFVRCHGSYEEAADVYKTSLEKIKILNESQFTTYLSRKCHVQLLANYLELQMTHGKARDQASLSQELSKIQSLFTLTYNENYFTKSDVGGNVIDTMNSTMINNIPSFDSAIVRELNLLSVVSCDSKDTSKSAKDSDEEEPWESGFPIFISNLSFKASEADIKKAFKDKAVKVLRVELKKNPSTQRSKGFGSLYLESEEKAKEVIEKLDRLEIMGRSVFLSWHKEFKHNLYMVNSQMKKPSVLHLSGIPSEWNNPKKIELALSKYGEVKSVLVNDKEEHITAKVEFKMPEDAIIACTILQEDSEFKDLGITVRKCFPQKSKGKRSNMESKGQQQSHEAQSSDPSQSKTQSQEGGSFAKRKYVPDNGKQKSHMKKRLSMPKTTFASSFPHSLPVQQPEPTKDKLNVE